jgi:polar amino acid transport system substrate-binding protein
MKKTGLVLALFLLAVSMAFSSGSTEAAQLQTSGKLKIVVASDATWPPMEYINESKEIVGFDVDLMKAVAEAGGFDVEIKNTSLGRDLRGARQRGL